MTDTLSLTSARATSVPVLAMATILAASSLTVMANATISPALPQLRAAFADTPGIETLSGLVVTLPSLFVVLTAAAIGVMADRMDRRPLMVGAMLLYAIGGASGLVAQEIWQLLIGRAVLGLGVAGTMTLVSAYVSSLWIGRERERFMGLQMAAMNIGGIVFMIGGGVMASFGWRTAFGVYLVALPLALLAFVTLRGLTRVAPRPGPGEAPTGPLPAFPWKAYAVLGSLALLAMATMYVLPTRLPFVLAELGVTNSTHLGLALSMLTVASLPGAVMFGKIRRIISPRVIIVTSFAGMALSLIVISQATSPWMAVVGVLIMGASMGPAMPNFMAYFMEFVPPMYRGRAAGLMTMGFFGGQFLSPLISAPLAHAFGQQGGFLAMAMLPVTVAVIAGLVMLLTPRPVPEYI
ncbi:MFS transporter [Maritimibacter alkaliphilus]|uniref:MFS transporter n=1 Tax=Maritimibacter alkaliphilus TaxID=404236 RepID=UPI001C94ABEC|nr:MFS transporter [Maritimibacter alkaliphilus]MBY6089705.1 MFS transporter [Maritimibacter alkaliphilus]